MRKNFGVKSWFYPQPVLIIATYDENGNPDAMNAAWGGLYDGNKVELCLSAGHQEHPGYRRFYGQLRRRRQPGGQRLCGPGLRQHRAQQDGEVRLPPDQERVCQRPPD